MRSRAALIGLILLAAAAWTADPAWASPSDDDCLTCHGDPGLKSEQERSVHVDGAAYGASIHGQAGIACVDCHADLKKFEDFPHAAKLKPVACAACHEEASAAVQASIHGRPRSGGSPIMVQCKDCPGTHDIRPADDALSHTAAINIPHTSLGCHQERVAARASRSTRPKRSSRRRGSPSPRRNSQRLVSGREGHHRGARRGKIALHGGSI